MSETKAQPSGPILAKLRRKFGNFLIRFWSVIIILLVVWATWMAVVYMVRYVFTPAQLPPWMAAGRPPLSRTADESLITVGSRTAPMAPVGHYHQVDRWYRPDPHNNCTASGCHGLLPHMKSKEIRAFANLHTTFTDCMACHDKTIADPVEMVWLNKSTGEPQGPPAALLLMRELETGASEVASQPSVIHEKLVILLDAILQEAGGNPQIDYLSARLRSSDPGSPIWHKAIADLREELPNHARGEYVAKLALSRDRTDIRQESQRLDELTRVFLKAKSESEERKKIHLEIHERVLANPTACLACHGDRPGRLDYEALGYWPSRRDALQSLGIARMIHHNRQGGVFHMPGVLQRPTSRPSESK